MLKVSGILCQIPNKLDFDGIIGNFAATKESIMRALTEDKKRFCKELLESEERFQGQKPLGDVFREFFGIDFFKKDQSLGQIQNSPFTVRLGSKINVKDEVIQKINEAIALVLLLEKEGMISYIPIETNRIIGEESLLVTIKK